MTNKETAARVLVVDDEEQILRSMKRLLSLESYEVITFNCAKNALEYLSQNQSCKKSTVDLVISDMRMPTMTGDVFLQNVASQWPLISRVLLTGYSDIESTKNAINNGNIFAYLQKPCVNEELFDVIKKGLQNAQQSKDQQLLLADSREDLENARLECKYNTFASIRALTLLEQSRFSDSYQQQLLNFLLGLAEVLQLDDVQQEHLYHASFVSRIGLLTLSEGIVETPYIRLSKYDRIAFDRHPDLAYEVLRTFSDLSDVATFIRYHREKYDGSGNHKLLGEEIPLIAQLFGIATYICDLKTGRWNGQIMSNNACIDHLKSISGRQFSKELSEYAYPLLKENELHSLSKGRESIQTDNAIPLDSNGYLLSDLFNAKGVLLLKKGTAVDHNLSIELQRRLR